MASWPNLTRKTATTKRPGAADRFTTIEMLVLLKEYAEATSNLLQLNKDLPEYGDYDYFNRPTFDRIKKEYPLFQQALRSIKRPPMVNLKEIIDF